MTQQPAPSAPSSFEQSVTAFRRPPVAPIVWFALLAAGAIFLLIRSQSMVAVAKCQGRVMRVGEVCSYTSRSRRGGRRSVVREYDVALKLAERNIDGLMLGSILAAVLAGVFIGLLILAWRRDLTVLDGLRQETPDASLVDRGLLGTVLGGTIAVGVALLGGWLMYRFQGGVDEWRTLPTVFGALILLVAALIAYASRPKGGSVLMLYPSGLGILSRGRRQGAAYDQVHYLGDVPSLRVNWIDSGRGDIDADDSAGDHFRELLIQRVNQAWAHTAAQRLSQGETLDFSAIKVNREGITTGGTFTPFAQIAGIRHEKDKDGTYYALVLANGSLRNRAEIKRVANIPVLRLVLQQMGRNLP